MQKCYNCNTNNDEEAVYCKKCGSNLVFAREQYFKNLELQKQEEERLKKEKSIKTEKQLGGMLAGLCIAPVVLIAFAVSSGNSTLLGLTLLGVAILIFSVMIYGEVHRR